MRLVEAVLNAPTSRPTGFFVGAVREPPAAPRFRILPDAEHRAPDLIDDRSRCVEDHLALMNIAEQGPSTIGADGYKI